MNYRQFIVGLIIGFVLGTVLMGIYYLTFMR